MHISGSRILLTGASGGLGQATARALAAKGAKLIVSARNEATLEALAAETGAEVLVADLTDRADVDRLADVARTVDVLIANAGTGADVDITKVGSTDIDAVIDVNLRAPILLATAFAQAHIEAGTPGQIVLVGSLSGITASPNTRMYNATKFGLRGYSLSLRQDLEEHAIGVTLVAPGFIRDAGMFAESGMKLPGAVRTKSPADVAAGMVKAIEANPPEVFVSPLEMRLGATLGSVAPGLSARIQKLAGAADITAD